MIVNKKIIFFFIVSVSLACPSITYAQKTKNQLKKDRAENLKKIKRTERILAETGKQKNNSLGKLNALNQRIKEQESLIRSIQKEINLLDTEIKGNLQIIETLEEDLAQLKKEYAAMLFSAQKASGQISKLLFLFSAQSFEQFIMRLKYMEQYSVARKNQVKVITRIQKVLMSRVQKIHIIKDEKNTLLNERIIENRHLATLRKEQGKLVKALEKEEKRFKTDLKKTRKAISDLDVLISSIIRIEIERKTKQAGLTKNADTAKKDALSATFENNKSKFFWPVAGFISQRFGKQAHPVLKGITIQNDGINIQTSQNEIVKALFQGEVRAVAFIPSIGHSIIIGHGNYFTVYSGLKEVLVKQGQHVILREPIGHVLTNSEGISELRFQIRKNTVALNPEKWLKNN